MMSFFSAKFTSAYLSWLFVAFLSIGWAEDITNNSHSEKKSDHVTTSGLTSMGTPITPTATSRPITTPSIAPVVTNWWDSLTTATPEITTKKSAVSPCLAPPQPPNGQWRLHKDSCTGHMNCNVSEGTTLSPGTRLVYSCAPGFEVVGTTDVYCSAEKTWTPIPTCDDVDKAKCECVIYHRCSEKFLMESLMDGSLIRPLDFDEPCESYLDVCCPKSEIMQDNESISTTSMM